MRRLLGAILALVVCIGAGFAQTFRGAINGTVSDPSGAMVAGASVKAIEKGTGVAHTTSTGNLILTAAKAANGGHPGTVLFGEGANLLWTKGYEQAAIEDEKLCNELTKMYNVDILCGYSLCSVEDAMHNHMFHRICAEHSTVHSR